MDHDAIICSMIDRLARGPDQDVHVPSVEWYYPALSSGVTHAVVNRSSAIGVVEQLNADPTLVTALSHAAKHVHNDFVSADSIALYLARVATLTRERMDYAAVLDDATQLLAL